jgi:hypothetical protein
MLGGINFFQPHFVALGDRRQTHIVLVGGQIVGIFKVDLQEAVKQQDRAGGAQGLLPLSGLATSMLA